MASNSTNAIEWALRVCQSMAFAIHGVLGVTEPFTGCLQHAFKDKHGAMPKWFWPVAGILLWTVAVLNFSKNDAVVLGAQAYICAFHMGALFYHRRIGHPLVAGVPPTIFSLLALGVVGLRTGSYGLALIGWGVCTCIAHALSLILVTPPPHLDGSGSNSQEPNLLHDDGPDGTSS